MARVLRGIDKYISLEEAARMAIRPIDDLTLPEYSDKLRQTKSVIQRAINDGQIEVINGMILNSSFTEWLKGEKVQIGLWIRREVWEKFKEVNEGKNLSFEIEKVISGML